MSKADVQASNVSVPAPDRQVRFSLRRLLLGMTVAVLFMTALTPLFRAQTEIGQLQLLIRWATALVVTAIFLYWDSTRIYRAYARARATVKDDYRFQLKNVLAAFANFKDQRVRVLFRAAAVLFMVYMCSRWVSPDQIYLSHRGQSWFRCFMHGALMGITPRCFWSRLGATAYLRDRGIHIDWGNRCIAWADVDEIERLSRRPHVSRVKFGRKTYLLESPAEIHEEVDAFVKERLISSGCTAFGRRGRCIRSATAPET